MCVFILTNPPDKVKYHQLNSKGRTSLILKWMQQILLKSNMLQSPFILGEGKDSLKGTETGSGAGGGGCD